MDEPTADALDGRVKALQRVPLLGGLSRVEQAKVAGALQDRIYEPGEPIFASGASGDELFLLYEGLAERLVEGVRISAIEAPAMFGELSLISEGPRSSTVVARSRVRVWALPARRFRSLLEREPRIARHLMEALARELAQTRRELAAARSGGMPPAEAYRPPAADQSARSAVAKAAAKPALEARSLGRGAWLLVSLLPLALCAISPPEGLSEHAWWVLLTLFSAAILFASEALPESVVAIALLAAWSLAGAVPAKLSLGGFASETWLLVLCMLGVGAAVGNSGVLYRLALRGLGYVPGSYAWRCLALGFVGVLVTPTLPNATSRMALAAPVVREIVEALGMEPRGKGATGLSLSTLIGFGQMAGLFLTGSSVGLLIYALLPEATRAGLSFGGWLLAALPLHLPLFAISMALVVWLYKPVEQGAWNAERLAMQRAVLGPITRVEVTCLTVAALIIAGFVSEPLHGIPAVWIGAGGLALLAAFGALDANQLRNGINWNFMIFFGAISAVAIAFQHLGIDRWLAASIHGAIGDSTGNAAGFVLLVALAGFVLSLVVRWQAAAPLLTIATLPVADLVGVSPFVIGLVALVSTQVWFFPYQSTVYLALYHGSGEMFSHSSVRPLAWLWGLVVLASIALCIPVWNLMGLVR